MIYKRSDIRSNIRNILSGGSTEPSEVQLNPDIAPKAFSLLALNLLKLAGFASSGRFKIRGESNMKQIHLMFALVLILASANTAAAALIKEAYEIPYQINQSDRIIIGTVSDIQPFSYHTIVTIEVAEWLEHPLPANVITVQTDIGTIDTGVESDEATFTANESVILMLKDVNISENRFEVVFGAAGKHPVSDRDAILKELAAREQAQKVDNSELDDIQVNDIPANKTPANGIPSIGAAGSLMVLIGAALLAHYRKHL